MLRVARSVISARREASASGAGLALSSSPSPTAETLQVVGDPQDCPMRRRGRMRRLPSLPMPSAVQRMSSLERALS